MESLCLAWCSCRTARVSEPHDCVRCHQVVCEVGKAVGAEGLVAGQIVDIKSEGMAEQVSVPLFAEPLRRACRQVHCL